MIKKIKFIFIFGILIFSKRYPPKNPKKKMINNDKNMFIILLLAIEKADVL